MTPLLTPGVDPLRWPAAHSAQCRSGLSSSCHPPRQQRCSCCPSRSSRCSCGSSRQPGLQGSAASRPASPAATNRRPCRCRCWWKAEEGVVSTVRFTPRKTATSGRSIKKVRLAAICLGLLTGKKTGVNHCSYSGEQAFFTLADGMAGRLNAPPPSQPAPTPPWMKVAFFLASREMIIFVSILVFFRHLFRQTRQTRNAWWSRHAKQNILWLLCMCVECISTPYGGGKWSQDLGFQWRGRKGRLNTANGEKCCGKCGMM